MFALSSQITIGAFRFSGVHEVRIRRSIHSIMETAVITIPTIARLLKNNTDLPHTVKTGDLFTDGDAITVEVGYNGKLTTEFEGFVSGRNAGLKTAVFCEGYGRLLQQSVIEGFWSAMSLKNLLQQAVANIDPSRNITVRCDADINFCNVTANRISGYRLIEQILKYTDNALRCFFIEPTVLWCGLPYSKYALGSRLNTAEPHSQFRPGYNALCEHTLIQRNSNMNPGRIVYVKRLPSGTVLTATDAVVAAPVRTVVKVLNHIADWKSLQLLANEKAYTGSFEGYEGSFTGFLLPAAKAGSGIVIHNNNSTETNAVYLAETEELIFGVQGVRRNLEPGPRLGFGS
jgi:hypothetical protein